MARKGHEKSFIYVVVLFLFFCVALYRRLIYQTVAFNSSATPKFTANKIITENLTPSAASPPHAAAALPPLPADSVMVLDWQVFVIVSPEYSPLFSDQDDPYVCVFENGETSPAKLAGVLPAPDRSLLTCELPARYRRKKVTSQPVLIKSSALKNFDFDFDSQPPLFRWNFLVYDSITTDDDVVLFVKGVNTRQGTNRNSSEFRCVFSSAGDGGASIKTEVTSSAQEVFRCKLPSNLDDRLTKVSLEIIGLNPTVVPSVAYYTPPHRLPGPKSLLCSATVVYNVAKNLKEWVMYHSKIGVERFILYNNNSDDELEQTVEELRVTGIEISSYFWPFPKTQESGFSHSSLYANGACKWMIFTDVDEFLYSQSWDGIKRPSQAILHSAIKNQLDIPNHEKEKLGQFSIAKYEEERKLGQLSIACMEFGPSNQTSHPPAGVTQGYNCRRRRDNRHKSIVLLEAIHRSLGNAIHHFDLKSEYVTEKVAINAIVVNHYKYQAWPEFKAKFRRRVSAYVIDWTRQENPNSNDRTPGLGYRPVEPKGWSMRFCEVRDNGLKNLARRWFGVESSAGLKMAWQSSKR